MDILLTLYLHKKILINTAAAQNQGQSYQPGRCDKTIFWKISKTGHGLHATKITAIAPASPAHELLSIDDELIALNGQKIEQNLQPLLFPLHHNETIDLTLFRDKKLRTVTLTSSENSFYQKFSIEKRADATEVEKKNFRLWLKQEF